MSHNTPWIAIVVTCLIVTEHPAEGSSVWWKYYKNSDPAAEPCTGDWGLDWVPVWSKGCVGSSRLLTEDPFRMVAEELVGGDAYLSWECDQDVTTFLVYKGGKKKCGSPDPFKIILKTKQCGAGGSAITVGNDTNPTVEKLLENLSISCTQCNWVFYGEDPPPYTILACGIMIFLTVCLIVNVYLKAHLDRMIRDRHQYFPAFFTAPEYTPFNNEVKPGSTVWINSTDSRAARQQPASLKARRSSRRPSASPTVASSQRRASAASRRQSIDHVALGMYDVLTALDGEKSTDRASEETSEPFSPTRPPVNSSFIKVDRQVTIDSFADDTSNRTNPRRSEDDRSQGYDKSQGSFRFNSRRFREADGTEDDRSQSSFRFNPRRYREADGTEDDRSQEESVKAYEKSHGSFKTYDRSQSSFRTYDRSQNSFRINPRRQPRPQTPPGVEDDVDVEMIEIPTGSPVYPRQLTSDSYAYAEDDVPSRGDMSFARQVTAENVTEDQVSDVAVSVRSQRRASRPATDIVDEYVVHAAPSTVDSFRKSRYTRPSNLSSVSIGEPLLSDPDLFPIDVQSPYSEVPSSYTFSPSSSTKKSPVSRENWKFPTTNTKKKLTTFFDLKYCVVCNSVESEANPLKKRERGWKCIGKGKQSCIGKRPTSRLELEMTKDSSDPDTQMNTCEGQLGPIGIVLGVRVGDDKLGSKEALVCFKRPYAWVSIAFAKRVTHVSEDEMKNLSSDDSESASVYVGPEKEAMWEKLISYHGCDLTAIDNTGLWVALRLKENTAVWLPFGGFTKVGDFHGSYIRVGPVEDIRNAAFSNWQEWWRDFAQCVGKISDIRPKGVEMRFYVTVDFGGGALITLPAETLRHASQEEYDKEFLLVPQPVHIRTMTAVFIVHPLLLAGKALFLIGYFVYSVVVSLSTGHAGYAGEHTLWQVYQEIYFKLFNSGYPTLMADFGAVFMYRVLFTSQDTSFKSVMKTLGKPVLVTLLMATVISIPGFFTHVLPMLVMYGWLWVPFIFIMYLFVKLVRSLQPKPPTVKKEYLFDGAYYLEHHRAFIFKSAAFHMFYRFCTELAAVICLQTNYNFAILFYGDLAGYLDTIWLEYELRSIGCIVEEAAKLATLLW
eukprot:TRINITY_DN1098_c0_g1_i1.p1 TRINITY_DN1098_c0_g1~~TRINITY_DN1098_c0_g1_i1.p1  ORF type:complete len:1115 (+),score=176.55 TRINITY_DN1098_c0_g1_i1:118-3462(+)